MPGINIQPMQTLLDIAMETDNGIDNLFVIALANGLGITDDLNAGDMIIANNNLVNAFYNKRPASAILPTQQPPGGIGFMQIGTDFIVS